jgi:hypothetical protein
MEQPLGMLGRDIKKHRTTAAVLSRIHYTRSAEKKKEGIRDGVYQVIEYFDKLRFS